MKNGFKQCIQKFVKFTEVCIAGWQLLAHRMKTSVNVVFFKTECFNSQHFPSHTLVELEDRVPMHSYDVFF